MNPSARISFLLLVFLGLMPPRLGRTSENRSDAYALARRTMIEKHLKTRGIADARVLSAMESVPRHLFVPPDLRGEAYADRALPIDAGQTLSQPYIVALMTQALELKGDGKDKVLEIGTGSGYQAAVAARIAGTVYTIEIIPQLARKARILLASLGLSNVHVREGDGYAGWEEAGPFDGILVTASADRIPQPLVNQLKVGGKLVMPLGDRENQALTVIERTPSGISRKTIESVMFVPMTGRVLQEKPAPPSNP